jgi:4-oxalocrotonate tautomerase family enzyme
MPVLEIHLLEGYGAEDKARLGRALTDTVRSIVPAAPEAVTVMMHELPTSDYYRGGTTREGAAALPDPVEIVRAFLDVMETRDLEAAGAFLGEGFVMTFPGAAPMKTLQELQKKYKGFEVANMPGGPVVYCRGWLSGEWPDGEGFANIRFVDRFELTNGKITKQDVWNDIADVKASM